MLNKHVIACLAAYERGNGHASSHDSNLPVAAQSAARVEDAKCAVESKSLSRNGLGSVAVSLTGRLIIARSQVRVLAGPLAGSCKALHPAALTASHQFLPFLGGDAVRACSARCCTLLCTLFCIVFFGLKPAASAYTSSVTLRQCFNTNRGTTALLRIEYWQTHNHGFIGNSPRHTSLLP